METGKAGSRGAAETSSRAAGTNTRLRDTSDAELEAILAEFRDNLDQRSVGEWVAKLHSLLKSHEGPALISRCAALDERLANSTAYNLFRNFGRTFTPENKGSWAQKLKGMGEWLFGTEQVNRVGNLLAAFGTEGFKGLVAKVADTGVPFVNEEEPLPFADLAKALLNTLKENNQEDEGVLAKVIKYAPMVTGLGGLAFSLMGVVKFVKKQMAAVGDVLHVVNLMKGNGLGFKDMFARATGQMAPTPTG